MARAPLIETLGEVPSPAARQEEAEGQITLRDTAVARPERLGRTSLATTPADKPVPERVVNGPAATGRSPDAAPAPAMDVRMLMRYGLMPKDAKPAPAGGAGFQPAPGIAGKAVTQQAPTQPVAGQQPAPAANALQNWSLAVRRQTEASREITDFDNDGAVDRFTAGYAIQPPAAATPQAAGTARGAPVTALEADHASRGGLAAGAFGGFGGGFGGGGVDGSGLGGGNFGRTVVGVPEPEQLGVLAKATAPNGVVRGDGSARAYFANGADSTFTVTNWATYDFDGAKDVNLGQLAPTTERLDRNLILGTRLVPTEPAAAAETRGRTASRLLVEQAQIESVRRDSTAIAATEAPVSFAIQVPQATASVPVLGDTPASGRLFATKGIALPDDSTQVTSADLDSLERVESKAKSASAEPALAPPGEPVEPAALTPPPTVPAEPAPPAEPQPEVLTADNPFSTFSLNVTDVAFKLAAASLEAGQLPAPGSIRVEEFVNAFDYRDPEPAPGAPLAFHWERARYPFAHNRDVLRFSVQTAALGREPGRPLNLVLLLDNSGSMERADRVAILREALRVLARQLAPQDQISVVAFARTARLWVDASPGSQADELLDRVGNLTPEGGTNLEDALKVGYETALRHFLSHGVNRVILLTDGAANLGAVEPAVLKAMVEELRRRGVALDCFGIGWEGYNDDLLEVLSRHGDGRYGFINTPEEAATGFADQLAGALQVAAADVKVQVEFNPARVASWRQIGYAKHQLTKEQFRDNTVDAAEIGAAESGHALYVIEVNPRGQGAIGILRVRYRVPATGQVNELEWPLEYRGPAPDLEQASPTLRLATAAAAFGEMLAISPFAADVSSDRLLPLLRGVPEAFHPDPRPAQLVAMIQQARAIGSR
ncbi:MAG: von Willebrand factor type A domain-containing protein [Verrucomicrobia bacterium]|nr:von Willebrand factor type A domain-containing protein [Verrucomicrobiota bacterium]